MSHGVAIEAVQLVEEVPVTMVFFLHLQDIAHVRFHLAKEVYRRPIEILKGNEI
jgi:hypothetical protein